MSQIVVIGFDTEEQARQALASLRSIEKEGGIAFEDTAIVVHHENGKMEVKNEASSAAEGGAIVGGLLGGLLFVVFPVAGIAIGALAGAGVGAAFGTGVDGKFVKDVKESLPTGKSALFLVIKQADADMAIAALRRYHGEVIQTSLDEETEEQLRAALSSPAS
jgi:uncharacterized membrane protein